MVTISAARKKVAEEAAKDLLKDVGLGEEFLIEMLKIYQEGSGKRYPLPERL